MQKQVDTEHKSPHLEGITRTKYNVLYVDDEAHNLRVFRSSFRRHYNVFTAESPFEAMKILKEEKIHLIVTDQKMPEMNGTEFLETILPDYPNVISMILTGFSDLDDITKAINECGIYRYITKPWEQGELKITLDKAIEVYNLRSEKEELIHELWDANVNLEEKVEARTEELSKVNSRLFESINYALNIQKSILSDDRILNSTFSDHFIYYSPLDVVSGDFYYFCQVGENLVIAAFDCTGHGVPGALLSILGYTALESIISDQKIVDPIEIITLLNEKVHGHLTEEQDQMRESDGMEGVILVVNKIEGKLTFTGANSEIVFIKDDELFNQKTAKFSVGSHLDVPETLEYHELDLQDVDKFFLFSDGYKDQLNKGNTKRYTQKKLKELLLRNHRKPMHEQHALIEQELIDWKGLETVQTDDIMILGLTL
ncbi:MAG: response regulator [Cyclobacteriaceae bacterium]